MREIFFYGLFMNDALLVAKGLSPQVIGPGVLSGYRIHIGDRAALLPAAAGRAHGIVMALAEQEARALYSEPSVRAYVPERVRVELMATGDWIEALCYNLPPELARAGANPAYATELSRLASELRFDPDYVQEIAAFADRG